MKLVYLKEFLKYKVTNPLFVLFCISLTLISCKKEPTIPDQPANLKVTPKENSNSLQWNAADGAEYYRIYWSDQNSTITTSSSKIDNITATQYEHTGLTYNSTYYYSIAAVNQVGESQLSSVVSAQPSPPLPTAPSNVSVSAGVQSITVSWYQVASAQKYTLYWTSDGSNPTTASSKVENITSSSYNHTSLDYKKTYKYCVCAINVTGTGPLSSVVQGKPSPPPLSVPTGFTATGTSSVVMNWDSHPEVGVTFTIYRSGSQLASGITGTTYTDNAPPAGKINKYKIKAVLESESRESSFSSEISLPYYVTINEVERNGPSTSLTTLDWCYYMEHTTANKEVLIINGAYSGSYSGYNAYMYKNYDWDLFELTFDRNDVIKIEVLKGTYTGLWSMGMSLTMDFSAISGGETSSNPGNPSISGNTYTWTVLGTTTSLLHCYLQVSMPNDLVNTGAYTYQLRITITRN
jgi:fibronectin type 3 domain-containing protein